MKQKIAVLGVGGMLGSMVLDVLSQEDDFSIIATVRDLKEKKNLKKYKDVDFISLDVEYADQDTFKKALKGVNWVINCIGFIKVYIHDDNASEVERAVRINALFPHVLAKAVAPAKIIQIATDCVYSGDKGRYKESDIHDPHDVYGKTKSIGEAYFENMLNIRCSIVGPEKTGHLSLMDWFLTQKRGAKLNGYKNHLWNGVTTYHFAKICIGIIKKDIKIGHIQHLVPADIVSKADLLKIFAKVFARKDVTITSINAAGRIDRTLSTEKVKGNAKLWETAGYAKIPTVGQMVSELDDHMKGAK